MASGIFDSQGKPADFPLKGVWIKGDLCGLYGELTVEQLYINDGEKELEVIYTFPLPDGAVISGMSARVGERSITGEVKEKKEAFEFYDRALAKGDSAYLLEQYRPNIFQISLGRVLPGEEVSIRVCYLETLTYRDGELRITLPTLVAPRYIPGEQVTEKKGMGWAAPTGRVPDADFITPPVDEKAAYRVALELNVLPLMTVDQFSSPSHELKVKTREDGSTQITLAGGEVPLDRDIIILGRCRDESTSAGLSWSDPETGESYCYLNLIPRLEAPFDREPLQYIFLIDISGSMSGIKLEQAKNALQLCLRNMEAGDSFDIIAFESRCHYFLPVGALPFNQDSLNRASRWIDNLRPLGGTEILEPVRYALDNSGEGGSVILLFTDGMVGNEQEIINLTRSRIKQNHLFTFGIDTAVNSHFINKLAEAGQGLPEFIHPGERLEDKVIRQFYRINSPAVKNATVKWSAALHMDCYPLEIPIIFDREPVALVGKYSGALAGTVSLTGQLQNDRFKTELDLADLDAGRNFDFLKKIWAKMKIDHLEKALDRINPRRRETLIKEIVKVSCEYGIGSSQTSFVALLERKNEATGIPETVVVPVAPAAEWRMLSPGFNQFQPGAGTVLFSGTSPAATSAPMPMPKYAGAEFHSDSGAAFGVVGSIEDVVRLIALQQQAEGSFPAEKGAKNAELSRFENTALAAPALLLSGNPALYRRQIEKSVEYLVGAKPQKKLEEFHYFAAALSARLYLEKFKPGEITARRIGSKMEALRERAGSLAALLEKPGLAEKEIVTELLGFTGDRKSSLKNVGPRSGVKSLAAAVFRELLQ